MTAGHLRVRMGELWLDAVDYDEAMARLVELVEREKGGAVYTPNVDHVVIAERNADFRRAHRRASLVLADGVPLLWLSRLLGAPLPEKLSGSDMVRPMARLAAQRGWRVYLLGGAPGVARDAAARLRRELGVDVCGVDDSFVRSDDDGEHARAVVDRIRAARPNLLFVALGAPKQEIWIDRWLEELRPAVAVAIGGSLDFVTGRIPRAPRWISAVGGEWLYRLLREPRRLWRRYLVDDPAFARIALHMLRLPRAEYVRTS